MANPRIFRAYDIRGIYGKDFGEKDSESIGKAFASLVKPKTVCVGCDNRESSDSLKEALIKGLVESGVDVIDVGVIPTPVLNFAVISLKSDGGIMVTASHLTKEYNGFKICRQGASPLMEEEIQEIRNIAEKNNFSDSGKKGRVSKKDITDSYASHIFSKIRLGKKTRVAVDTGNGVAGPLIESIFRKLGIESEFLFCEMDCNFPNHHPDPTIEENLACIKKSVSNDGYSIGIALDGDGDRAVFIDEKGNSLRGDQALALFARDILRKKNATIFTEVRGSRMVADDVKAHGGNLIMGKIGHSFIKKQMKEDESIEIAGEVSGHIFFRENNAIDDGIFAACKMVELVSSSGKSLSEMVSTLPKYFSTPEIRLETKEETKFLAVEEMKKYFKDMAKDPKNLIKQINETDGIRVEFEDGWGLFRASNTSPMFSMRFEAKTEERMKEIENIFMEKAKKFIARC